MSVTFYNSTDAGAPVLTGQAGSFINLLDTLLVGSGTAYGSKPKAGWSKPYAGTDKGVYCTADGVGYYRVQHDGAHGVASTREAVVRGAEGATNVDTLVDAYPTTAQVADAACVWRFSSDTTATARPWIALATPNFFWILLNWSTSTGESYFMGRYLPRRAGNAWAYIVSTRATANSTLALLAASCAAMQMNSAFTNKLWAMRNPSGSVKSVQAAMLTRSAGADSWFPGRVGPPMPDIAGEIHREPSALLLNNGGGTATDNPVLAGYLPQVWYPLHGSYSGSARLDTFTDTAYNPSAQFLIVDEVSGAVRMRLIWEITDTWDPYG